MTAGGVVVMCGSWEGTVTRGGPFSCGGKRYQSDFAEWQGCAPPWSFCNTFKMLNMFAKMKENMDFCFFFWGGGQQEAK